MSSAIATTSSSEITPARIETLVADLAERAQGLADLGLDELVEQATQAQALASLVGRCKRLGEQAERGQAALDRFGLEARRHAAVILAQLDNSAGGKGRGKGREQSERRAAAEAAGIGRREASRLVKLADLDDEQIQAIVSKLEAEGRRATVGAVIQASKHVDLARVEGTNSDDCYTPAGFIEPMRKIFGGSIDCDPTSCLAAQGWIRARAWWSLRSPMDPAEQERARVVWTALGWTEAKQQAAIEHGIATWRGLGGVDAAPGMLTQEPAGCVFGQPPYSAPRAVTRSIVEGYRRKRVRAAVILVNVATSSAAQQELLQVSSARLWIGKGEDHERSRMAFVISNGVVWKGNQYDQVAYFLGDKPTTFAAAYGGWGTVKIG